jgi:hypothetical protein
MLTAAWATAAFTGLAVVVAAVGGWIALRQLREQQDVIRRQTAQLERRQAEKVGFSWESARPVNETLDDLVWMGVVLNDSHRPIRDVICRLQPGPGRDFDVEAQGVAEIVDAGIASNVSAPVLVNLRLDRRVALIRAGARFAFKTSVPVKDHGVARMMVRFTDDAGLQWQVDPDLHLEKLERREW